MAGTKIRTKFKASVSTSGNGKKKPVKPRMTANSGLLTARIIAVVEKKKEAEKAQKDGKNEKD